MSLVSALLAKYKTSSINANNLLNFVEKLVIDGNKWSWIYSTVDELGIPYNNDLRYMIPIYLDDSSKMVILKGRQVTMSTYLMISNFYFLINHDNVNVAHVLPTATLGQDFSKMRYEVLINENPFLKEYIEDNNIMMRKFVGNSFLVMSYLSSATHITQVHRSKRLDRITADEGKDLDPSGFGSLKSSQDFSKYKQFVLTGTPDYPETVFMKQYESSDKMNWFVKCKCGLEQKLTPENIKPLIDLKEKKITYTVSREQLLSKSLKYDNKGLGIKGLHPKRRYYYSCNHCGRELDRINWGHWVSTHNEGLYRGYYIPQIISHTADEIIYKKNSYREQEYYNEVLGLPLSGELQPISTDIIAKCRDPNLELGTIPSSSFPQVAYGLDTGGDSDVLIKLGKSFISLPETIPTYTLLDIDIITDPDTMARHNHIKKILRRDTEATICSDHYDDYRNKEMWKEFKNRFWVWQNAGIDHNIPTFETVRKKSKQILPFAQYYIKMNHSILYNRITDIFRNRLITIPTKRKSELLDTFTTQCSLLRISRDVDKEGYRSEKISVTGAHSLTALAYAFLCLQREKIRTYTVSF